MGNLGCHGRLRWTATKHFLKGHMHLLQVEDTRKCLMVADILRQLGGVHPLRSSCGYAERAAREREALCALQ